LFQNGIGGLEMAREMFLNALGAVVTYGVYREGCRAELWGMGAVALPRGDGYGRGQIHREKYLLQGARLGSADPLKQIS
jgi:ketopantoate reductase